MPKTKIDLLKEKLNDKNSSDELKKSIREKLKVIENNLIITK